jgi:hypothetical protein
MLLFRDTWRTLAHFECIRTLLQRVKDCFVYSPARKNRYLNELSLDRTTTRNP